MTANELTAKEIEARPTDETNYQLSQRIYDTAAKNPDQFQAVVKQLDQDVKSGAAPAVKIDYDNQGKVAAITINNEDLYNSGVANVPGALAAKQLGAEIRSGDMDGAINEGLRINTTFGLADAAAIKKEVLDDLGTALGNKLKNTDLTDARQYLANLQQSSASSSGDLPAVLQKAKEVSGLGDRVTIETDSQTGAVSAFKVDGQDLLGEVPQSSKSKDAPVSPAQANTGAPPVDLFKSERNEIPDSAAPVEQNPVGAAKQAEQTKADRDLFEKAAAQSIDHHTKSLPVRLGEGYYQVVSRMHKDWSAEHRLKEAHHLKNLNGHSSELRVGQRLPLVSNGEKAEEVKKRMEEFDQATPEQRKQMVAEAREQAEKYAHH